MQPVQVLLTDELAGLLAAAAQVTLRANEESHLIALEDLEKTNLERLAVFMTTVASNPEHFAVAGGLAATIGAPVAPKGPARTPKRSKRKRLQERRMSFQKRQRKGRAEQRVEAEAYNEARALVERDMEERAEYIAEQMAKLESEPKFDIVGPTGETILYGVPQSLVRPSEPEVDEAPDTETNVKFGGTDIVLPAKVEKAMEREVA